VRPSPLVLIPVALVVGLFAACVVAERVTAPPPAPKPAAAAAAAQPEKHDFAAAARKHPGLPIGSHAPDFRLPDREGHSHSLSEFRGERTLLLFLCGCSRCQLMVSALQKIEKVGQGEKPQHLSVMTMNPNGLLSWQDRTGYRGTFLFDNGEEKPVVDRYDGAPCPRIYLLDPNLRVEYVSPSPDAVQNREDMLHSLANALHAPWQLLAPPPVPSG